MTQAEVAAEFGAKHFVESGQARICYRKAGNGPAPMRIGKVRAEDNG